MITPTVRTVAAVLIAFRALLKTTLVGSTIPLAAKSSIVAVRALNPLFEFIFNSFSSFFRIAPCTQWLDIFYVVTPAPRYWNYVVNCKFNLGFCLAAWGAGPVVLSLERVPLA